MIKARRVGMPISSAKHSMHSPTGSAIQSPSRFWILSEIGRGDLEAVRTSVQ